MGKRRAPAADSKGRLPSVLHVELGGAYGGSLRALETVLRHTPARKFEHDLVLCYPTPNLEGIRALVAHLWVLYDAEHGASDLTAKRQATPSPLPGSIETLLASRPALARARGALIAASHTTTALKLRRMVVENGYDLIHVNNTFNFCPAFIWAGRLARRPVVAHVRNPVKLKRFSRMLTASVSRLVAINQRIAAELAADGVRAPVSVVRDPLAVRTPLPSEVERIRGQFAEPGDIVLVSVGRLTEQKGYEFLLQAAATAFERISNLKLVIVGDGPLRQRLERTAADLGLNGRVRFAGFRSDVSEIVSAGDIFVCSSLWEGGPLTVFEAMTLGKPVISTDVGTVTEYVRDRSVGTVVPTADRQALAKAIIDAATLTPQARAEIGEAGRLAAQPLSDAAGIAAQFSEVLTQTLV